MSDELRFRRPTEADHAQIVGQVDDWWGGRRLHDILPRLWFQHFTGTSWVVEDADGRLLFTLHIADGGDSAETSFAPDELKPSYYLQIRLYRLWGELLQARNERQLQALNQG